MIVPEYRLSLPDPPMKRPRGPAVRDDASFGLAAWCGLPVSMGAAHRHNDIELNYLVRGACSYRFGDQELALTAGDLCLFWAARPHQLLVAGDGAPLLHWVTLPLAHFLSWRLPNSLSQPILRGAALTCRHPAVADAAAHQIAGWHRDIAGGDAERQLIVRLELEALLRRFALQLGAGEQGPGAPERRGGPAERMARFIVEHHQQPLSVAQIAAHVGLHPHYAMQRFRDTYGVSVMSYLTQYRVAHAQELLATSELGVVEIGLMAGFGSASRFYSAFKALCGMAPGAYRATLRAAGGA